MASITSPVQSGKASPRRTCYVWQPTAFVWVLTITHFYARKAAQDTHYYLKALASDWGRAFAVTHLAADGGECYHVCLTSDGPTCDCKGFVAHQHCKHAESLVALDGRGKLNALRPACEARTPTVRVPAPVQLVPVSAGERADAAMWDSEEMGWDLD